MTTKTITFTQDQLFLMLDAMEGYDVEYQYGDDEEKLVQFDKIYKRLLKAYQKLA